MKRLISLLILSITLLACAFSLIACGMGEAEGVFTLSPDGTYYSYEAVANPTSSEIVVPAKYQGKPVKKIAQRAFATCSPSPTKVTLPSTITTIESYAFWNCVSLTEVNLPNGLEKIGEGAFKGCQSLASISLPDSVTEIGVLAFENCKGAKTLSIGSKLSSFPVNAFIGTSELKEITVSSENSSFTVKDQIIYSKDLTKIVFVPNTLDIESFTVPDSVTNIGEYAFYKHKKLTNINLGKNLKAIGDCAFGSSKLTSITFPETLESVGKKAFANSFSLKEINFNNKLSLLDEEAFSTCKALTTINFAKDGKLEDLKLGVFENCSSLTEIIIPDYVKYIRIRAFHDCVKVEKIVIGSGVKLIENSYSNDEKRGAFTKMGAINGVSGTIIPKVEFKNLDGYWGLTSANNSECSQIRVYSKYDVNYGHIITYESEGKKLVQSATRFKMDNGEECQKKWGRIFCDTIFNVAFLGETYEFNEVNEFDKCKKCKAYTKGGEKCLDCGTKKSISGAPSKYEDLPADLPSLNKAK